MHTKQDETQFSGDDLLLVAQASSGERGLDQRLIAETGIAWVATMLRKNHDYGSSAWKPPILAPELPFDVAIRVRMSDKIERLVALLKQENEVIGESRADTIGDLGSYCLLLLAGMRRGNVEGEMHVDCSLSDETATSMKALLAQGHEK